MKIQDSIGRRMVPLIVDTIEADTSGITLVDKLNRVKKSGLMDPGEWNIYRKIRNDLARTYSEEDTLVDAINEPVAIIPRFEEIYQKNAVFLPRETE